MQVIEEGIKKLLFFIHTPRQSYLLCLIFIPKLSIISYFFITFAYQCKLIYLLIF